MDIQTQEMEKIQNELQAELQNYQRDPESFESYLKTIENINTWLNNEVSNENN